MKATLSPDLRWGAVVAREGDLWIYRICRSPSGWSCVEAGRSPPFRKGKPLSLEFSPRGDLVFLSQGRAATPLRYDAAQDRWSAGPGIEAPFAVHQMAFSADGRMLALGGYEAEKQDLFQVLDLATLRRSASVPLRARIGAMAFTPDGAYLVTGVGSFVTFWDFRPGTEGGSIRESMTFNVHDADVRAVAFSPDGRTMATGGGDVIKLWRIIAGGEGVLPAETATLRAHRHPITGLAFSPDGRVLVSVAGAKPVPPEQPGAGEVYFWYAGEGL